MGSRKDREGRLDEAKKWGGVSYRGNPREERERGWWTGEKLPSVIRVSLSALTQKKKKAPPQG